MDRLFDPSDDAIRASRAHARLVDLKVPLIYTTNYDRIIERTFELKGAACHTIANLDDMGTAPADATLVVKFHGTFSDDASLVLTESSCFDRLEFEWAVDIELHADTLGKSLLFVGYSLGDINIRYLLYKLHKLRRRITREQQRTPSAYCWRSAQERFSARCWRNGTWRSSSWIRSTRQAVSPPSWSRSCEDLLRHDE